jgi:hypothetical protein
MAIWFSSQQECHNHDREKTTSSINGTGKTGYTLVEDWY